MVADAVPMLAKHEHEIETRYVRRSVRPAGGHDDKQIK